MGLDAHHPHMDQKERVERVSKMMEMVGLNPAYMNRYPNQFSVDSVSESDWEEH